MDLVTAANTELLPHLKRSLIGAHFIVAPAFVRGDYRLYTIELGIHPGTGKPWYRWTSRQRTAEQGSAGIRIAVAGTGGIYLAQKTRLGWRGLLRLLEAHDSGRVSAHAVADRFARLNHEAHQAVDDGTVGPRSIVVWRRRPEARRQTSGGGHQFYTGVDRDPDLPVIPMIVTGLDARSIGEVLMKQH